MPIPSFRVIEGELPRGLRLLGGGYLRGAAERIGEHRFAILVDNGCTPVKQRYSLSVRGSAILSAGPHSMEIQSAPSEAGTPTRTLVVSSDWPGLAYTASTSAPWIKVQPLRGRTSYPEEALAADPVSIEIDTKALSSGEHRAEIRITSWEAAAPLTIPVTLVVVR
jgi:hypothetical protein